MKTILAACMLLATVPAYAGLDGDVYRASYVCNDALGKERWRATAEIRHKEGDVYTITEKMEGVYTGFDGKISWVATTDFRRTIDAVKPLNMDQRIFDAGGRAIAVITQEFDYAENIVTNTYRDLAKNTSKTTKLAFSGDIINRLLQGVCGQKFVETGAQYKDMQVVSPEPAIYNIRLEMIGRDDIDVDGVGRKAYKLCFDPQLGFLNFIKAFLPKAYVWHSAEPIYEWLRYEGLESSVNSPLVEIISLDKDITTSITLPEGPAR